MGDEHARGGCYLCGRDGDFGPVSLSDPRSGACPGCITTKLGEEPVVGGGLVAVPVYPEGVLVVTEPAWCAGHRGDVAAHPQDFAHTSAETALEVATPRGEVRTLLAVIEQVPFRAGERGAGRPFAAVELDGDWYRFDPAGLRDLAQRVGGYVPVLEGLADQLAALLANGAEGGVSR